MGGIGSGAQRTANAGNVEDMLSLDIRVLRRLDVIRPGECVCDTVRWSNNAQIASSARLRTDLCEIERGGVMTVVGDMPDGAIKQDVAIELLPSRFGGYRCFFVCPITALRCEILYYAGGRFASRTAQRLSYTVQGMCELSRARRKSAKLRSRLSGSRNLPRPRGRNRTNALERLRETEIHARMLYLDQLRAYTDRSGSR